MVLYNDDIIIIITITINGQKNCIAYSSLQDNYQY